MELKRRKLTLLFAISEEVAERMYRCVIHKKEIFYKKGIIYQTLYYNTRKEIEIFNNLKYKKKMKTIAKTRVPFKDGTYEGVWSGGIFIVKIDSITYEILLEEAIRCLNCEAIGTVKEGILFVETV